MFFIVELVKSRVEVLNVHRLREVELVAMAYVLQGYSYSRLFDHPLGLEPAGKDGVFGCLLKVYNLVEIADDRVDGLKRYALAVIERSFLIDYYDTGVEEVEGKDE